MDCAPREAKCGGHVALAEVITIVGHDTLGLRRALPFASHIRCSSEERAYGLPPRPEGEQTPGTFRTTVLGWWNISLSAYITEGVTAGAANR